MNRDNASKALSVCTIADCTESILLISDCLTLLPEHSRIDLQGGEALGFLEASAAGDEARFDLVLVAIRAGRDELLAGTQAVLRSAAGAARLLVLFAEDDDAEKLELPAQAVRLRPGEYGQLPELLARNLSASAEEASDAAEHGQEKSEGYRNVVVSLLHKLAGRHHRSGRQTPADGASETGLAEVLARPNSVVALQGLSGGVGTTTLAVNLAQSLAQRLSQDRICLLDLNLQFGLAGAYLGLPDNNRIMDAYRNPGALDEVSFEQCLTLCGSNLLVFSAPELILPLDALNRRDVTNMISIARRLASKVIIDMPHAVLEWSGAVYGASDATVLVASHQISSVRNGRNLQILMRDNGISTGNFRYVLNRAPTNMTEEWAEELRSLEIGLNARFSHFFPEGGPEIALACDTGVPVTRAAPGAPLTAELVQLAERVKSLQSKQKAASVV